MKSKLHTILFLLGLCCASVVSLTVTAQDFLEPDKMARIWSPEKESECQKLVNEFENLRKQFPEEQRRVTQRGALHGL